MWRSQELVDTIPFLWSTSAKLTWSIFWEISTLFTSTPWGSPMWKFHRTILTLLYAPLNEGRGIQSPPPRPWWPSAKWPYLPLISFGPAGSQSLFCDYLFTMCVRFPDSSFEFILIPGLKESTNKSKAKVFLSTQSWQPFFDWRTVMGMLVLSSSSSSSIHIEVNCLQPRHPPSWRAGWNDHCWIISSLGHSQQMLLASSLPCRAFTPLSSSGRLLDVDSHILRRT